VQLADPSFASSSLGWLATFLVHSTLWIGGAWLVARRVDSAAWRERLWRGSIAGGLLTSALVMALPTASVGWRWEMPASAVEPVATDRSALDVSPIAPVAPAATALESAARPSAGQARSTLAPSPARDSRVSWNAIQAALLVVWLTGAALSLAHFAWAHLRHARALRSRRRIDSGPMSEVLARVTARARLPHPPRLSTSAALASPVALARGEIVVPERALSCLGAAELESLLGHELAHVSRRDPWWLLALNVLRRALWLQPLLALATARAVEAAEMRCDELAARWTRGELALARCLAEVATWIEGRPASRLLAGMAEQPSALVERVERLLSPRPAPRAQGALVATWLIGMLSALSCAGPKAGPAPTSGDHEASATNAPSTRTPQESPEQLRSLGYVSGENSTDIVFEENTTYIPTLAAVFEEVNDSPDLLQDGTVAMADADNDGRPIDEQIEQLHAEIRSKMKAMVEAYEATGETPDHIELELSVLLQRAEQLKLRRKLNPHVVWIHKDGSIVCCQQVLVPAGSDDDAPLIEHVRDLPMDLKFLRLQVDGQASHALLHRVLKASAAPDVGIQRFSLSVDGSSPRSFETIAESKSEPNDINLGQPNSIGIALFIGKVPPGGDRRVVYSVHRRRDALSWGEGNGVFGVHDLPSLESKLQVFRSEGFDYPVLIDAAPEALCSEVLAVCDLARKVGFQQIRLAVATEDN
jgi:beta-lactamase regulating signal transducer with metallopeptidase domain